MSAESRRWVKLLMIRRVCRWFDSQSLATCLVDLRHDWSFPDANERRILQIISLFLVSIFLIYSTRGLLEILFRQWRNLPSQSHYRTNWRETDFSQPCSVGSALLNSFYEFAQLNLPVLLCRQFCITMCHKLTLRSIESHRWKPKKPRLRWQSKLASVSLSPPCQTISFIKTARLCLTPQYKSHSYNFFCTCSTIHSFRPHSFRLILLTQPGEPCKNA